MGTLQKEKRWARNWDCCRKCGTTERPHRAHGLCGRCYARRNECIDCGAEITCRATRCASCANEYKWRVGKMDSVRNPTNYCIDCGTEITQQAMRCNSCAAKERWARGCMEDLSAKMRAAWERGDFDGVFTEDVHQKWVLARKKAWKRGLYGGVEWRRKNSAGSKAAWARGAYDGVSEAVRAAWARGDFDGVFQSPTSIELQVAAALDIMGIAHESQYRPDGYSRIYDEFVPHNTLIEVQGDYFHSEEHFPGIEDRDAEKAAWAEENGYRFIVIWEHEIQERGAWAVVMGLGLGK